MNFSPSIRALLLGEQKSGKSTRQRLWTDRLIHWTHHREPVISTIVVCDRNNEEEIWSGSGPVVSSLAEFWEACRSESIRQGKENVCLIPRVIVRAGADCRRYLPFLQLAIEEGNFCMVFCEVSDWIPSQRSSWPIQQIHRGISFDQIFRAGRHIPDATGAPAYIHTICDTQEAIGVSPLIRNQANYIACSCLEGSNNLRWVRDNLGRDGQELSGRVQNLGEHEWIVLRDKLDSRVPKMPLKLK